MGTSKIIDGEGDHDISDGTQISLKRTFSYIFSLTFVGGNGKGGGVLYFNLLHPKRIDLKVKFTFEFSEPTNGCFMFFSDFV